MFKIKTLAGTGLVVLALAALGASAPVASAKTCKAPEECYGVLVSGIVNPIPEPDPWSILSESAVEFTGGTLVVNCPQGELNGSIIVVRGNLQGTITGASFGPGECSSSMGPMSVTGGPAPGMALPALLKTNGKAQLGGPFMLKLSLDEGGPSCTYAAKSIKGTYNTDEEPIVLGSKPPKFTLKEGGIPGCPKKLTQSANSWDVEAGLPTGGEAPVVFTG